MSLTEHHRVVRDDHRPQKIMLIVLEERSDGRVPLVVQIQSSAAIDVEADASEQRDDARVKERRLRGYRLKNGQSKWRCQLWVPFFYGSRGGNFQIL